MPNPDDRAGAGRRPADRAVRRGRRPLPGLPRRPPPLPRPPLRRRRTTATAAGAVRRDAAAGGRALGLPRPGGRPSRPRVGRLRHRAVVVRVPSLQAGATPAAATASDGDDPTHPGRSAGRPDADPPPGLPRPVNGHRRRRRLRGHPRAQPARPAARRRPLARRPTGSCCRRLRPPSTTRAWSPTPTAPGGSVTVPVRRRRAHAGLAGHASRATGSRRRSPAPTPSSARLGEADDGHLRPLRDGAGRPARRARRDRDAARPAPRCPAIRWSGRVSPGWPAPPSCCCRSHRTEGRRR